MKKSSFDIAQTVTNRIIESIEAGGLKPWECPWIRSAETPIPYNFSTKAAYSGINVLILWMTAQSVGYSRNAWITYKQAQDLGGQVRKGEKATQCIFVKKVERLDDNGDDDSYLCRKAFNVFNVEQVDGLNLPDLPMPIDFDGDSAVEAMNQLAEDYCNESGVTILYGGDQAYYSPALDLVRMPVTFKTASSQISTLSHELAHSTGHHKRLNRFEQQQEAFNTKREAYGFEELVATLTEAYVCAHLCVEGEHESHASYIDYWLKALKGDKNFIFKAAAAASKAYQYLLDPADTSEATERLAG